ncbi:hypothetical protein MMC11_007122 [Xylographa trunciseda]|nr:hypothetical protein [Xylographa trunciseda]
MTASETQASLPSRSLKRKISISDNPPKSESTGKKRRKKAVPAISDDLHFENGFNNALGGLDRHLLADYIIQKTRKFTDNLRLGDLEENRIPLHAVRDTSNWQQPRTLENLPEFIRECSSNVGELKSLATSPKMKGSPHTIVVTAAGLRAADITRSLRVFETKDAIVAKLFAKHKKLTDAADYVRKTRIGIGVGTPARLIALLDSGALSSDKLERIVVDVSHIDQKKRGILDMKETFEPLVHLLSRADLKGHYIQGDGRIDLLFF